LIVAKIVAPAPRGDDSNAVRSRPNVLGDRASRWPAANISAASVINSPSRPDSSVLLM